MTPTPDKIDPWLQQAVVHPENFAYRDLVGIDRWEPWTVAFSLTVVGAPTYSGFYRIVGAQCFFQVQFSAATSVASVAGTSYLTLPIQAKGLSGMGIMTDTTTNIAVGLCHIDVPTSRCYLPTQVASANTFLLAGWYEIAG